MDTSPQRRSAPQEACARRQRWTWLLMGIVIGAAGMFLTLRVLQEMINEPPPKAR